MLQRHTPRRAASRSLLASFLLILFAVLLAPSAFAQETTQGLTPGALNAFGANGRARGLCPLKHTDVRASVAGFLARVTVTQEFENPFKDKIEAVYTFPLPQAAAVDDMTMRVGERTVKGKIMRREEARRGLPRRAQRRPGGKPARPGAAERLHAVGRQHHARRARDGRHQLRRDAEVRGGHLRVRLPDGRRPALHPRHADGAQGSARAARRTPTACPTPRASRRRVARPGTRAGHDISVEVSLDAGVPVEGLKSSSHEIDVERPSPSGARVRLQSLAVIPNKDFILRYDVAGQKIQDALLDAPRRARRLLHFDTSAARPRQRPRT